MDKQLQALMNRYDAIKDSDRYDEKIELSTQIIALAGDNRTKSIAINNRGVAYIEKGEYDHAIHDCDQAIKLNPKNAYAFNNRGLAYTHKGEYDQAISDCSKAIKINPKYTEAFFNRGVAYTEKDKHDKAISDYNETIKLNPKHAKAFNNRGIAYADKGEYDQAISDYNQAIKLNPEYADAFYNCGRAYRAKGDEEEAIKDFKEANKLDPTVIVGREVEKEAKKTKETQNFQAILEKLEKEFKKMKDRWFWASVVVTNITFTLFLFITFCPPEEVCISKEANTYPLYVFLSVITAIVIRQYTTAKQLYIEAMNRIAMAKMLEHVESNPKTKDPKQFLPPIIDAIVYSIRNNQSGTSLLWFDKIKELIKLCKNK